MMHSQQNIEFIWLSVMKTFKRTQHNCDDMKKEQKASYS